MNQILRKFGFLSNVMSALAIRQVLGGHGIPTIRYTYIYICIYQHSMDNFSSLISRLRLHVRCIFYNAFTVHIAHNT